MMKKQYSHLVLFLSLCTLTACNDSKNEDSIDPDPLPPSITYHVEGTFFYTKENPIFLLIYAQNLLLLKIFIYQQHKTLNNMMKKQYSHLVLFLSLCTLNGYK